MRCAFIIIKHEEFSGISFPLGDFNMINNISDQASSFPGTQLNQSDNFLDSLREFFAILNSSRKGELSTWDTIYLHLILAINADSDLIKNDELLAENIPSANYQFNIFLVMLSRLMLKISWQIRR